MKPDQVDLLAFAMLGNLEEVEHPEEPRRTRKLRRDIRKTNWLDRINFNLALIHAVARADLDVRSHPYANTAGDFSFANSVAQTLCEDHTPN